MNISLTLATSQLKPWWTVNKRIKWILWVRSAWIRVGKRIPKLATTPANSFWIGCDKSRPVHKAITVCLGGRAIIHMAVGFKPAGGIRTAKQSSEWLALVKEELGPS